MANVKLQEGVRRKLMDYLHDAGYSDITDFWRATKIQVSHETVRRALHGGKPTSVETFIKIAVHLGMPKHEVIKVAEGLGDTFWPGLLKDPRDNKGDMALLYAVKPLAENENTKEQLFGFLRLLASSIGVNIENHLKAVEDEHGLQNSAVS